MSIRPSTMDVVPETSFEDVDGTFGHKEEVNSPQLAPASAASTTTDNTTFSKERRYSSSTELGSDEEIVNYGSDFEEYGSGVDVPLDVDSRFRDKSDGNDLLFLQEELEKKLSLNLRNGYDSKSKNNKVLQSSLRQPKSMMNITSRKSGTGWSSSGFRPLPNSRSYMNLQPRNQRKLGYKMSMPSLQHNNFDSSRRDHLGNSKNNGDFNRFSPFLSKNYNGVGLDFENDEDMENFADAFEDPEENFGFNERVAYPKYLDDDKDIFEPALQLSPSQYEIEHDDSLLTPQLYHRKYHDTKLPLDSYREKMQQKPANIKSLSYRNDPKRIRMRLKTIKQEIDHNSPLKRGRMEYNPKEKKWDGNEDILKRFENVENIDRKAFLIKNKRSSSPILKSSASATKLNAPSHHGKVVGKMKFDEQNLRWLRADGEDDTDPFEGIADVLPKSESSPTKTVKFQAPLTTHSFARSQSHLPFSREDPNRLFSSDSTRFHSLNILPTTDPTFQITSKQLERFYREENKWSRKVGCWFILGSSSSDNNPNEQPPLSAIKDKGYMYEIRNMVLSSAHN